MERHCSSRNSRHLRKAKAKIALFGVLLASSFSAFAVWEMETLKDRMGRGDSPVATAWSKDPVRLDWPYNKGQRAYLNVRKTAGKGIEVFLVVNPSQFDCGISSGCQLTLKFDNEKAAAWRATPADSGRSEAVFFSNPASLVAKIRKSKTLLIEATFFRQGAQIMEFKVDELPAQFK